MNKVIILIIVLFQISCKQTKVENVESMEPKEEVKPPIVKPNDLPDGWEEITDDENFILDIKYASEDNFVKEILYECPRCILREQVAHALKEASKIFKQSGYKIVLYDCYRPSSVQKKLWEIMPNASYVTPPWEGSMHNRGAALDISLAHENGKLLNMGTAYDFFGKEAYHDYLDHEQSILDNRKLLKETLGQFKFGSIRTEWWHYSYTLQSYEVADWEWPCPK